MSAHKRIRAITLLVSDRGLSREAAEVIALALFPLDTGSDGAPISRQFPKKVARRTKRFRKTAQTTAGDALVDLARETIEDYCDLAVSYGEPYYITKLEEATAGPAPWVGAASTSALAEASTDAGDNVEEPIVQAEPR